MPLKNIKKCLLVVGILISGLACTDSSEGTGKALINIRLIDAPGDFDEAWIEIDGVEVRQSRDRQGNDAHWVYIPYDQPNQQVDISKLVGEGVLLLGRQEVPVGAISKIKLILGDRHHLIKNGKERSLTLKTPDDAFIEMEVDYPLEDSYSYDIYLDFDLERSIRPTSDTTKFLLSPVVRSFLREKTSEIGGKIKPSTARPVMFAIQGTDTITTLADVNGNFKFRGLKEGKHTVAIRPRKPYLDSLFSVESEIGKLTPISEITLKGR